MNTANGESIPVDSPGINIDCDIEYTGLFFPFKHSRLQVMQSQGNAGGKAGVGAGNPGFHLNAPQNRLSFETFIYFQVREKRGLGPPTFTLTVVGARGLPGCLVQAVYYPGAPGLEDKWD